MSGGTNISAVCCCLCTLLRYQVGTYRTTTAPHSLSSGLLPILCSLRYRIYFTPSFIHPPAFVHPSIPPSYPTYLLKYPFNPVFSSSSVDSSTVSICASCAQHYLFNNYIPSKSDLYRHSLSGSVQTNLPCFAVLQSDFHRGPSSKKAAAAATESVPVVSTHYRFRCLSTFYRI